MEVTKGKAVIANHFVLGKKLGSGSFGEVYIGKILLYFWMNFVK